MKVVRAACILTGLGFLLWGVSLMRDFTPDQLVSIGTWLAGGLFLHDAVLAPLVVGVGYLASRWLPRHARAAAGAAFVIWATLTVAFFPVLSGQGGKSDNDTILNRPYLTSWLILTAVLAAAAGIAAAKRRRTASTRASAKPETT